MDIVLTKLLRINFKREAIASLFLSLQKKKMKLFYHLLIISFIITSCSENENSPTFSSSYGEGIYICTDNGVSFYRDSVLKTNIFYKVNGISLSNVQRIKFKNSKAFFALEKSLYSANVNTFEIKGIASGFTNLVDFDFVSSNRIFATDKDDSRVKVLDRDILEIISEIETGDSTRPSFIITEWYRSIILNGGELASNLKDSTIVAIDHKDEFISLASFMGSLYIGENPNSAINDNDIYILCKGIYDTDNMPANTNSTLVRVDPIDFEIKWIEQLNAYNAKNLVFNENTDELFFTASDGIYKMNKNSSGLNNFLPDIVSDVLFYNEEEYSYYNPLDSTTTYFNRDVLYFSDSDNDNNIVYKYNLDLGAYMDTIILDAPVNDINFY